MRRFLPILVLLVCLSILGVALLPAAAHALTVQITTGISANTSWGLPGSGSTVEADVFWIRASVSVNATYTLTMRQGIVVKFDPGTYLNVAGSLQATGTAGQNVIITSIRDDNVGGDTNGDGNATLPSPSDWQSIYFTTVSPDTSRLTFAVVRFAGYGNVGALTFTNCSARLTNCTISRSYFGIECAGTANPRLVDTGIQTSTMTPIVLDFTAAPVFSNLVFSSADNGYDAFGLRGGALSSVVTLPQRGATVGISPVTNVTYVLLGSLTIGATGGLTIDPGVVIKPSSAHEINVSGNLTMNGTAADTITVTSISDDNFGRPRDTNNNGSITAPARGNWGRIVFNQGSTGSLQYCRLKFGNNSDTQGMLDITNVNLPVSNTLLSDASHGIAIRGTSAPVLNTVQINNCSSTPTYQSVSATPTYTNIGFLGNSLTALGLINETIAVDSRLSQQTVAGYANITYLLRNGHITMNSPATLTIDPGVVVKFQGYYVGLTINGALVADGTPGSPIVFTSYRDDLYGNPGDTNGDGSTTTPALQDWGHIKFGDTSNDATSILDYCRVSYGAYIYPDPSALVWCVNASPTISNCTISKSFWGIRLEGNSAPSITSNTIQNCGYGPIAISVQADPTITGNTFLTNGYNGIGLLTETMSQSSVLKYRPTVTFPPPNQATVFAYIPTGTITIPAGVTLAIEPQVVLKPSGTATVFDVSGALNAVGGTGANRVVFTSLKDDAWGGDTNSDGSATSPGVNDWGNLYFQDASVDAQCLLRNCLFQFGSNSTNGVVTTWSASPKLAALEFFQNGTALTCRGNSQPNCDSLSLLNCTNLPIVQSLVSDPKFAHMTMANNSWTAIGLLGETVAQDVRTYPRVLGSGILDNITYMAQGSITIAYGATWTIAPGAVIKLGRLYNEPFGLQINIDGALVADGKPDSLIVFTSNADDAFGGDTHGDGALTQPAVNDWLYLSFSGTSNSATSVIDNCRFRYGGYYYYNYAALRIINANTNVSNTAFYNCYMGASVEGNAAPTFTNVNVDTCTIPIRMSLVSNPAFTNVNFLGCTYTALGVVNETLAQDVLWKIRAVSGRQNMPYLVDGTLAVGLGSMLTLQPGLIVKLKTGTIDVNRAFIAEGRTVPESLIVFTSYRDDFYGGRTYVTTTPNVPAYNDWSSIIVEGTAIDPQVRFRNCVVRYGGSSGSIRCVNSAPSVDSCIVAYNYVGIQAEGASNPTIHGSSIYGNTNYGVNNPGGSFCLSATGNWWGAANGPLDASGVADLCGALVNAGSGDKVSQNVDYTGFTTGGLQNPLLGDVSLNGQVRAYDASLILQYLVPLITLSPLQQLVADVDNSAGITALDASLILQYVAGIIPVLPGNTVVLPGPVELAAARAAVQRAQGTFDVSTGAPRRVGDHWEVPVLVSGSAPINGAEIELRGENAGTLDGVTVAEGALEAHGTPDGHAKLVLASAQPIPAGEIAAMRFPGGDTWQAPTLTWARVNGEIVVNLVTVLPAPQVTAAFLAPPAPNPARGPARLSLGISTRELGARAVVRVHDLAGRTVRVVHEGALEPGVHELTWDLRDEGGRAVPPGLYLLRAEVGGFRAVRRLIVVR